MWGLILAAVAIAVAFDGEMRIKRFQKRLWHVEKMIKELRAELHARPH